jgi:hypothetical protein
VNIIYIYIYIYIKNFKFYIKKIKHSFNIYILNFDMKKKRFLAMKKNTFEKKKSLPGRLGLIIFFALKVNPSSQFRFNNYE